MEIPLNFIKEGLTSVVNFFITLLDYLNPFSDNFILKKLWEFLVNIISYINPFSENFFGKKIIELISDLFEFLFIPAENPFTELSDKMNSKFIFISQIRNLIDKLLGYSDYGENCPSFNMTWKGVTFAMIDFSLFINYRPWLHGIILAISWFIFARKLYNKIPGVIGGFGNDN